MLWCSPGPRPRRCRLGHRRLRAVIVIVTLAGLEVPALYLLEPVLAFGTDVVILAGAEAPALPTLSCHPIRSRGL
jgi:hypothetical protein